tara:strand:- start:356 stop:565 length:210 start_codon:yes stop_codon:yes gene_type:complete
MAWFNWRKMNHSIQLKTTLKWDSQGELSSIDMARILDLLANKDLIQCSLASNTSKRTTEILFQLKEPTS